MRFSQRLVALNANIEPGAFSGERIFEVILANGEKYRSLAPRQFCWNHQGKLLKEDEPTARIEGMIAARIVDYIEDSQVLVEVPDGEIIAVDQQSIQSRPTSIRPPIQESRQYVSV